MWTSDLTLMMLEGVRDTLFMTLLSTFFGYVLGLPWGIVLAVTDKSGIRPNAVVYRILDVAANILRSIPFFDSVDSGAAPDEGDCGKKYGSGSHDRAADHCGCALYRPYDRIFY